MDKPPNTECAVCGEPLWKQITEVIDIRFKTRRCYECQRLLDKAPARRSA